MQTNMYVMTKSGTWVPLQGDDEGSITQPVSTGWSYAAASGGITDTADNVLVAAAGAGSVNYLTSLQVQNSHATTSTEVVVKDGSTVIWRHYAKAAIVGQNFLFPNPLRSSVNAALNVACITTGTATYVNAQGYQSKSVDQVLGAISSSEEIFDDSGILMTAPDGSTLYLNLN